VATPSVWLEKEESTGNTKYLKILKRPKRLRNFKKSENMNRVVYIICVTVGSYLGDWVATLFGAGYFSIWGIVAGTLGAIAGVYIGYKINDYFTN
jgi:uncharacterized membrane protein YeaQ/YmgE (transglycosylase-associated protein family)